MFKRLFQPGKIGTMELRNRIVMPALGLNFVTDNQINDKMVDFYTERAVGGVALVYISSLVEHTGEEGYEKLASLGKMGYMPSLGEDRFIPGWRRLAEACHRHGGKLGAQLVHVGKYAHSSVLGGVQPVSPSPVKANLTTCGQPGEMPRELTIPEIQRIVENIANTVKRAREAGLDTIEYNLCSGYLMREFLSPITNQRTDEYGGSLENRMRFVLQILRRTREKVGPDFPLTARLSADEFLPGGNTLKETRIIAQELEKAGLNGFSVVGGGHETSVPLSPMSVPRGAFVYLAQEIKKAVKVPVIASARINDPFVAERILQEGRADFLAIGRPLMADPDFPRKAQEGRYDEIRPCIACNQGCFDIVFRWKPVTCLMNPRVGREAELQVKPAGQKKRVLVVGGGPAGMEAARVMATRGHQVSLYERSQELGGQVNLSSVPHGRQEFGRLPAYLKGELERLGVQVHLGTEVDAALIEREKPEAVVVATGAEPIVPDIPGINGPNVAVSWDVLSEKAEVGQRVVIIGGGSVGCETAIHLAKRGAIDPEAAVFLVNAGALDATTAISLATRGNTEVTIVEMLDRIGRDFGAGNRWVFLGLLKTLGIKALTGIQVEEIGPRGVRIKKGEESQWIEADTVVVAVGARSVNGLHEALREKVEELYLIGDAQEARKAMEAVHEGFLVGCQV